MSIPSTPADGYVRYQWVPAIADVTAPTTTELGASGAADLSCYLTGDGWQPSADEAVIQDDRQCDVATFEQPGRVQRSLVIKYIENPTDTPNNVAYTTLVPRTAGFIVVRRGLAYSTAFASSQKVQVWPVKTGEYQPQAIEVNSVLKVQQKMHVTAGVKMSSTVA